jgi:hypothetical protein
MTELTELSNRDNDIIDNLNIDKKYIHLYPYDHTTQLQKTDILIPIFQGLCLGLLAVPFTMYNVYNQKQQHQYTTGLCGKN